jgi:4-oxalmesaconate hydratase
VPLVIDCHGHYTTAPAQHEQWRALQIAADQEARPLPAPPSISDVDIRESVVPYQLARQRGRGIDMTIFSPRAGSMGHHLSSASANAAWSEACNDLIFRVCSLFPSSFIPVCQLPQTPGVSPRNCIAELRRCVTELGFIGVNLNPDPTGGYWTDPPLTDRWWYPVFECLVELDVPAMIHVSSSCNPNFHFTGAHYLNGDTSVFMQLLLGDLFADFPTLKLILPHGGGAVPYHWGRYRGLAQDLHRPPLDEYLLPNLLFDTCVYHQPGIDCLTRVIPATNILFGSETFGAVNGIDPETGHHYDDTRRYLESTPFLTADTRGDVYNRNPRAVYPRLAEHLRENDDPGESNG